MNLTIHPHKSLKPHQIQTEQDVARLANQEVSALQEIISNKEEHYGFFRQEKKDGTLRDIHPPRKKLKLIQRKIKKFFDHFPWPRYVQGGIRKRSILSNARLHCGKKMVAWLDIRKFFPSTNPSMVLESLEKIGIGKAASKLIVELGTYKNALPQGSPASVSLANLVFLDADDRFELFCKKHRLIYSRYIDDISISGDIDFRPHKGQFLKFIEQKGYVVAKDKIDFIGRDRPQIVNNLVVNDKVRPNKDFINDLKNDIRCCWTEEGMELLAADFGLLPRELQRSLWGRINFTKQFDPKLYKDLKAIMIGAFFK